MLSKPKSLITHQHQTETNMAATKRQQQDISALQVGAVFSSSWGYEQTNVDFYRVTKVTRATITLEQIDSCYQATGPLTGQVTPDLDSPGRKPITRRLRHIGGSVRINSFARAHLWDGRPMYVSHYA